MIFPCHADIKIIVLATNILVLSSETLCSLICHLYESSMWQYFSPTIQYCRTYSADDNSLLPYLTTDSWKGSCKLHPSWPFGRYARPCYSIESFPEGYMIGHSCLVQNTTSPVSSKVPCINNLYICFPSVVSTCEYLNLQMRTTLTSKRWG